MPPSYTANMPVEPAGSEPTLAASFASASALNEVRDRVSREEWQARVELAALYRAVAHFRWTDTIFNHISYRLGGVNDAEEFLINPFGLLYEEVTASSLVKIDVDGNILDDPTGLGINAAGFIIHGAVHAARPDVKVVVHTHTRAGVAVAAQEKGLLPISQHAALLMGRIGYHDFEGLATRADEQARLVANLGDKPAMLLRNHGVLVAGRSAAEAFNMTHVLERACDIQIAAMAGGSDLRMISDESIELSKAAMGGANAAFAFDRDWAAMKRLLDRVSPGYDA